MDCSPPGSSVHGIFQARVLEWGAIAPNRSRRYFKKRWQEHTEELYQKCLSAPDSHDSVVTYPEPDILEGEVKWALRSITMNTASGVDGIPAELFQIIKDDAIKVLYSICQ